MIETRRASRRPRIRRPRAVSLAAILLAAQALLALIVGALVLFAGSSVILDNQLVQADSQSAALVIAAAMGLSLVLLASVYGLLRLREWAWFAAIMVQGIILAATLIGYFRGTPHFVSMAVSSLLVLALNQREVWQAFQRSDDDR
ncbi:MAG: hypothetical protein IT305_05100 [Chloroflexi bacterium]|nr:hypothetical protein [Chloroflexota bacterium]